MAGTRKGRKRKDTFSVTKAVKANARTRVGQPRPARILPDETKDSRVVRKHKVSIQDLIEKEE
jgi:hypothetical protein